MKCQTIIDPETKIALEGDALVVALRNLDPTRCGYELHEDDVFCPSCGKKVLGNPECSAERTLSAREICSSGSCVLHLIVGTIVAVLCAVGVFYCGAAYTYVCKWIPIILVILPVPLGLFVGVPEIATVMAYRRFEVKKLRLCFVLGALFGCMAVYGAWFWFVRDLYGVEEWNPFRLWGYAHEISAKRVVDVGTWRLGNGIKVTGGWLLFFYYLEALFIIMMSFAMPLAFADNLGHYCSTCSRWMRGYFWKDANMTQKEAYALVRRMTQNDQLELFAGEENERRCFRFKIQYCKKCGQGALGVSVVAVVTEQGEKKEVEIRVFKGLQLTKAQVASAVHILKYDNVMSDSISIWKSNLGQSIKAAFIRFG